MAENVLAARDSPCINPLTLRRSKAIFQTDGNLLTEHGRRLRIWSAEISPGGADDVIEVALRQVLRVARVVQLQPWKRLGEILHFKHFLRLSDILHGAQANLQPSVVTCLKSGFTQPRAHIFANLLH